MYGSRLQSLDGQWLLPVATLLLCSDTTAHVNRGSVPSWDLCAPQGSPIYAAAPGKVIYAGCNNQGGYGCWVKIDHGGGISSAYAHMITGSIVVRNGQQVDASTLLGQVGWTGKTSFGPHTHFVIYANGQHVDPANVFDQSAMQYCALCSSPAGNATPRGTIATAQGQPQPPSRMTRLQLVLTVISQAPAEVIGQVALLALLALLFMLWLSPNWLRAGIAAGVMSMACGVAAMWLMAPVSAAPAMAQPPGDWQEAYKVVIGSEGAKCTNDVAYTAGGITQGTYNAWRRSHGMAPADVCTNLTEAERQAIFYERYWVASGAAELPFPLGLTYVDHYFNTGGGKVGLTKCGNDVRCFNDWRLQDYQSKANCSLYCAGWRNRVTKIRQLTEGTISK
jgi:hypothetical protein